MAVARRIGSSCEATTTTTTNTDIVIRWLGCFFFGVHFGDVCPYINV